MTNTSIFIYVLTLVLVGFLVYHFFLAPIPDVNSVIIKRSHIDFLKQQFNENTNEFGFCIDGKVIGDAFAITELKYPEDSFAGEDFVFSSCRLFFTKGFVHSHPAGICSFSETDIYTFGLSRDIAHGIVCGNTDDKIVFFTPDSLTEKVEVIIDENG